MVAKAKNRTIAMLSVPDPDEAMDAHVDELVDEHDIDLNNSNAVVSEIGQHSVSPQLPEDQEMESAQSFHRNLVNTAALDLEVIVANYKGHALINRLMFIADSCPPLQKEALVMLINYVTKNTANVQVYTDAYRRLEILRAQASGSLEETAKGDESSSQHAGDSFSRMDNQWIETTSVKSQARLDLLNAEFKRQKDEGVKESTRRAMDDLFQQQLAMGLLQDAAKLYGRGMREYCTSPKHIIQMLLNWIEVLVHLQQWGRVEPLVVQVQRAIAEAIEAENVAATSTSRPSRYALGSTQAARKIVKELISSAKAKVTSILALCRLATKNFKEAAEQCMKIDLDFFDYPTLLGAKDIALFGTICALATFDRCDLKEKVLGSVLFCKFLQSEPNLVELLQKFCKSQFGTCFDILDQLRDELRLNLYLAFHIDQLYEMIRHRAIIQYFAPYEVADMNKMADIFRVSVQELENELVQLIETGELRAKIDSFGKRLLAKDEEEVSAAYNEIIEISDSIRERSADTLLRATLQQSHIAVTRSDVFYRNRRRPAQEYFLGDEYSCDRFIKMLESNEQSFKAFGENAASSSATSTKGGTRGLVSRFLGLQRNSTGTNASQAVEADSSNDSPQVPPLAQSAEATTSMKPEVMDSSNSLPPGSAQQKMPTVPEQGDPAIAGSSSQMEQLTDNPGTDVDDRKRINE